MDKVQPTSGAIKKKIFNNLKRYIHHHKKHPNTFGDEDTQARSVTPSFGIKLYHSPSNLQNLCSSCFMVVGKRASFLHDPLKVRNRYIKLVT